MTETAQLADRLRARLQELETEFETGRRMLAEQEAQTQALRETLLRLTGAITVLREELAASGAPEAGNGHAPEAEHVVAGRHADGG